MRNVRKLLTPENVYVEYELAGLGSRFAANCIDTLLQGVLIFLIGLGTLLGGVDFENVEQSLRQENAAVIAIGISLLFVILFGYHIFFEMLLNGQTPGKKALKLRVLKQNGEPVGLFDSLLRNVLRIADFLPSFYLVGAMFLLFTKDYKRIGDFAANTIVVRKKTDEQPVTLDSLLQKSETLAEERVNLYPLNNFEYGVLKDFLARSETLGERKPVFTYHLNKYFMKKFHLETPYEDPFEFFRTIVQMNSGI
jgi:uncharacterized RDD family membrane protein YckC